MLRGPLEKQDAPLDEFLSICAPLIGIIPSDQYQQIMGWIVLVPAPDTEVSRVKGKIPEICINTHNGHRAKYRKLCVLLCHFEKISLRSMRLQRLGSMTSSITAVLSDMRGMVKLISPSQKLWIRLP